MEQTKRLQETLERSLEQLNREAMKALAAQITATVRQLQNGDPEKVSLFWDEQNTPKEIKEFIYSHGVYNFEYAMLLPQGKQGIDIEIYRRKMIQLKLPQNILIIIKKD